MAQTSILQINTGRVASVRVAPNQDLIEALDQAAAQLGPPSSGEERLGQPD